MYVIDSCHSGTSTSSKLTREGGFMKALYGVALVRDIEDILGLLGIPI